MAKRIARPRRDHTASAPLRRVALLLNFITRRCRQEICGIHSYAWPVRQWIMRTRLPEPAGLADAFEWKPDGIIAEVTDAHMVQRLRDCGIPVVNVASQLADQPFARVESDDRAIGRMAAEHFLAKGFRHYGYLGARSFHGSQLLGDGFAQRLGEAGYDASVQILGKHEGAFHHWAKASGKLVSWLRSLPKPAAVFAYDDHYASLVSQACITAGLAVPEQVALLGVENDDVFWRQAYPPLSSIQTAAEQVGFEAARVLDRLMSGGAADTAPIRIPPIGVVERASTSILAIHDPEVAMAVRFMSQHLAERINVEDVVNAVAVSRRVLKARFRRIMKRTILEELHRLRVERAGAMLLGGTNPVPKIANQCGFRDNFHFWAVFRKLMGMSPAAYRRKHGRPEEPESPDAPDAAEAPE